MTQQRFFLMHVREWKEGVEILPRQGQASGKADGFFRIRAGFLDLKFF
jgi:hypothetical protein